MTDPDIRRVLDFWFSSGSMDQPTIDSRMDRWFTADSAYDAIIRHEFGPLVERAARGELDGWAGTAEGRLALIVILDQFRRNIYRGTPKAFSRDAQALKLCVEGAMRGDYKQLSPIQQAFYFMPLQHAESLKIQERSVKIYEGLVSGVSETLKATLGTFAQFAELHHDIIAAFSRFPHRNRVLGRPNTPAEAEYLESAAAGFGN
jgi:uncharacterized protein (DUF924 family)